MSSSGLGRISVPLPPSLSVEVRRFGFDSSPEVGHPDSRSEILAGSVHRRKLSLEPRVPPFPPRVDPHCQCRIPPGQRTTSDFLVRARTTRLVTLHHVNRSVHTLITFLRQCQLLLSVNSFSNAPRVQIHSLEFLFFIIYIYIYDIH